MGSQMKITYEQLRALDGPADSAPRRQLIVLALWGIFNKRKCKKLLVYLKAGMSWKAAYSKTKKS